MGTRITERKKIDVAKGCDARPVYLNWLGTNGGRNYWLFEHNQTKGLNTSIGETFEPYIEDNTNATTYLEEVTRGAVENMTVGAFVPVSKLDGIKRLLFSPHVLMLMNPESWEEDGPMWVQVFPDSGSFKLYDTIQETAEIQLTIRFNEINIQSQ